ncbi:DNA-binding protein smubp-2, partial [Globisporangium splendens]
MDSQTIEKDGAAAKSTSSTPPSKRPLAPTPLDVWVDKTRKLLVREKDEEIAVMQQELDALDDLQNPNVLVNLKLAQYSTGLFGRTVVKLAFPSAHVQRAKPHQFTVGDLVQLRIARPSASSSSVKSSSASGAKYPTGIVARVEETALSIALSESDDVDEDELLAKAVTIDRLVNNATFVKLSSALDRLAKFDHGAAQSVVEIVFSGKSPSWNPLPEITPFNPGMNESQLEAIRFALASKDLALIHGPPGTGKTTTVVELIRQAVTKYKMKVLVCAPSNIAVDNVLEKLATADGKLQLTRIGHPARLLPQVLKYCLDAKIEVAEGTEIVNDIRKEMTAMQTQLQKTRDKSVRFNLRHELKVNRTEIRQREQNVVQELVRHSDVVFATNVGASSKLLKDTTFDLVVIDEAAQALEASCWIPILKAKRCVLAGDHLQLPPTIKSKSAASDGLELTLFDRITRFQSTQSVVKMLKIQYRMHEHISDWSSSAMYNNELQSFDGVARRKLHELPHVSIQEDDDMLNATLLLLDTAGCELEEGGDDDDGVPAKSGNSVLKLSKSNEGEARVVAKHVRALLQTGLKQEEVAVITPYNKQVQALKALLLESFPKLEIRSVDGFQGCEKEAVVMSLVRSNARKQVGFLADDRRMNVAITRAKRHVAVVCDTDTISAHKFLDVLVKHFERFGEYRSAQEYLDDELVQGSADQFALPAVVVGDISDTSKATPPAPVAVAVKSTKPAPLANSSAATKKSKSKKGSTAKPVVSDGKQSAVVSPQENVIAPDVPDNDVQSHVDDDSKEGDDELETKQASVFQMMASDSESSEDELNEEIDNPLSREKEDLTNANSLLKELHLSRLARQQPSPSPAAPASKNKKKKGKKNNKSTPAKSNNNGITSATSGTVPVGALKDGEDELDFLARQAVDNKKCSFQGTSRCKKSTATMGSLCRFCKLKFCYDHGLPEVHGCGDAVRQFERTQFQQRAREPAAAKTLSADKRKLLKKKLDDKVAQQTATRKAKSKETKK